MNSLFNRRWFLQMSGSALAASALSGCRRGFADIQASPTTSPASSSGTLHVYTWSGYTDDQLLQNFEQATGIRVIADIFDSNETMLAKMQAGGGNTYSVIYPSDYMVQQMVELNMLSELDRSKLEHINTLQTKFQNPVYDSKNQHSIPAIWGTTGLVYNTKQVQPSITDWDDLWERKNDWKRRLTLFNDVREVMGATLRSMGKSYNTTDPLLIEAAYNQLVQLKPAIVNFTTDGWRDQVMTGDVLVAMAYSSDAIALMEENPDIAYTIPASGSSLWVDTMAIPRTAPNPEAAYAWINYVLNPQNLTGIVERLKFATSSKAATELLPAELRNNKNLYPPQNLLEKCEGIAPVDDKTAELYDRYWTRLTSV
ncbi:MULTISPECIES: spermidine/putrescine ABC transporter substrate-binding protein [unclassified Leptolyngbya]|uniref:ABC transporter substrate-binding protein n=1 Tax=unclassified Leptolyngbya TaxID=2650499 RepID=UPI0016893F9B|nr:MULTISPECIES: spermidine/putrescine ABC transporter substrate-binding protein [unclassified Leptolyngbya]MBD1910654.1 spermidine/putrescine ABC transporter substrate-binding protein [Leptolyngbya sp. FACHB-8]MBD2157168.1 spermidine/putrescine ABC transporter substrate-binding protein [Leptolyngbya sp. FACHB-16]